MDPPTRLCIFVDGASSSSSDTNIRRIHASVQRGTCRDKSSGVTFKQTVTYLPGIGDRIQANVLGQGYLKQIQDVYESCSQLLREDDEVWFFGFGRGAWVTLAVAGLMHTLGCLSSAGKPEFARDFKKMLKDTDAQQGNPTLALSRTTSVMSTNSSSASTISASIRPPPKIQFVGVFETIKAMNDDVFDVSFNRSICHMRQALSIHEDRKNLTPEALFPEEFYDKALRDDGRSFIQSYFVGLHNDIGGAAKKHGLALYPCQWMLLEAQRCGLVIDPARYGHDPLSILFPRPKEKTNKRRDEQLWSFTTDNGISVAMQDLREVHGVSRGGEKAHAVKLASPALGSLRQKKSRNIFSEAGHLLGFCDWAPQGTIIHPSVYLLLDEHINIALETKELKLQRHIEDWRSRMLGASDSMGGGASLWTSGDDDDDSSDTGAIRVLVCGNTGVGKSTLINKTFGVDVTQSSHRSRGIHDVREEMTWQGRPDLIIHDSGGFEAGADDEFQAIETFLKEKSEEEDILARVHVIWFCLDINSARTTQQSTVKLFSAVSQYAKDVPVVVVATKKDDLFEISFGARRKKLKKEGWPLDEEECERYAEEKVQERIDTIRSEMESVPDGRLNACLAVSQDDDESISQLSKTTSHCFDTDKLRILYVRAQVSRIDLKIDMAQAEITKRYKKLIRSTAANWVPGGMTITRKVSNKQMMTSIINCFGLPSVRADVAIQALKASVWSTFGSNVELALAEAFHLIGLSATGLALGSPIWMVTGAMNSTVIVPTTCRLFLMFSCDLTLVLARSFKEVTARGQPSEKEVASAARYYALRGYSTYVHDDVKKLIPRKDVRASFNTENVQRGVEDLLVRYKDKLMGDVDLPLKTKGARMDGQSWDDTSTEADSILFADAKEALAEVEGCGPPIQELDACKPMVELPAENKLSELDGARPTPARVELEGSNSFS